MENRFSKPLKLFLIFLLLILLAVCISLLRPRFIYQQGITQLKLNNYKQAAAYFEKAEKAMPETIAAWFGRADLFRIYTNHGQALYFLGNENWKQHGVSFTCFAIFAKAGFQLKKAAQIEPQHYINTYWLTRTQQALEKNYAWLHPEKKNPYNAYPYYEKALALRPAGITVRYSYVKYLYHKGFKDKIPELVQYMMEIHPPSYYHLKKEPFFNTDLILSIEKGLNSALEKEILPREALSALSSIYSAENNFEKAISYYKDMLDYKPSLNSPGNYIHMGSIYLKNRQFKKSYEVFEKVLISADNPGIINSIYKSFKREKLFLEFFRPCRRSSFKSHPICPKKRLVP